MKPRRSWAMQWIRSRAKPSAVVYVLMGSRRGWRDKGAINTVTNRRTSRTRIQHLLVSLYPNRSANSILLSRHGAMTSIALQPTKAELFTKTPEHTDRERAGR